MDFAARLKLARVSRGWTLEVMANYLGVGKNQVHLWESGKRKPWATTEYVLSMRLDQLEGEHHDD